MASDIPPKRKRNINFTSSEEELLVELVDKYKHIIENKKTDMIMWKEKKACWEKLTKEFNCIVVDPKVGA